jgi:CheY-like chemotaxis protein
MSRVLLIDDDPQINEVVKAALEVNGHVVEAVEDADQTEQVFAEFQPNLTLVDYSLPGRSGLELVRVLGRDRPGAIRFLATGMADFGLLRQAVAAGASSMLCKPYRISDLAGLLETATLLEVAMAAEKASDVRASDNLRLECPAHEPVRSDDLARLMAFARVCGGDEDFALRRLPIVACELMRNAATHGSAGTDSTFRVEVSNHWRNLQMRVRNSGPAFAWERAIARARVGINKSRASGLQLVLALTDELYYENEGRVACARLPKRTMEDVW